MLDLIKFDASSLFKYTNGQISTTGNEPSWGTCIRIDPEGTIKYALTQKTTLGMYTVIRRTGANWMSFDVHWTRYTDLAKLDHSLARTDRIAC